MPAHPEDDDDEAETEELVAEVGDEDEEEGGIIPSSFGSAYREVHPPLTGQKKTGRIKDSRPLRESANDSPEYSSDPPTRTVPRAASVVK